MIIIVMEKSDKTRGQWIWEEEEEVLLYVHVEELLRLRYPTSW